MNMHAHGIFTMERANGVFDWTILENYLKNFSMDSSFPTTSVKENN
jgi:hypothetical protein